MSKQTLDIAIQILTDARDLSEPWEASAAEKTAKAKKKVAKKVAKKAVKKTARKANPDPDQIDLF